MFARAERIAEGTGGSVAPSRTREAAVEGADVVVTDTWISMGKESEEADRARVFGPCSVTSALMALRRARRDRPALPAGLPRHGDRAEVLEGPQSVVWDEAENRRHAQKAVLAWLLARSAS